MLRQSELADVPGRLVYGIRGMLSNGGSWRVGREWRISTGVALPA